MIGGGLAAALVVPLIVGAFLSLVGSFFGQATSLQQATQLGLSPSVFLPQDANVYIRAALGTIAPFDLWYLVLLAIGFAALHRSKPAKGATFAVDVYALGLAITMAGAAIGAAFAPGM